VPRIPLNGKRISEHLDDRSSAIPFIIPHSPFRIHHFPMVLLEFSVSPLGAGESVSPVVARCLEIVDRSGLDYQLHAMGTLVEGELDDVLGVLRECVATVAADFPRVTCTAKLDVRRGHSGRLQAKVASVERQLGRQLKKTPGK
jgi:uncharacterized protein (TIGR00106 family)